MVEEAFERSFPLTPIASVEPATSLQVTEESQWTSLLMEPTAAEGVYDRAVAMLRSCNRIVWGKACRILAITDGEGKVKWARMLTEHLLVERTQERDHGTVVDELRHSTENTEFQI